jgi:hypothetical protein
MVRGTDVAGIIAAHLVLGNGTRCRDLFTCERYRKDMLFFPQDANFFLLPIGSDVEPAGYSEQTADYGQFI